VWWYTPVIPALEAGGLRVQGQSRTFLENLSQSKRETEREKVKDIESYIAHAIKEINL
jgi:hypothetical protein